MRGLHFTGKKKKHGLGSKKRRGQGQPTQKPIQKKKIEGRGGVAQEKNGLRE